MNRMNGIETFAVKNSPSNVCHRDQLQNVCSSYLNQNNRLTIDSTSIDRVGRGVALTSAALCSALGIGGLSPEGLVTVLSPASASLSVPLNRPILGLGKEKDIRPGRRVPVLDWRRVLSGDESGSPLRPKMRRGVGEGPDGLAIVAGDGGRVASSTSPSERNGTDMFVWTLGPS